MASVRFRSGSAHPRWKGGVGKNSDGYLRFRAGPLRDRYCHREYASRQWQHSYGVPLPENLEVHHLCRCRTCWPPTDFHLLILDAPLHHAFESGDRPNRMYAKKVSSRMTNSLDTDSPEE